MSKLYVQGSASLLQVSSSLAGGASTSGSAVCLGYARLVGGVMTNGSTVSACGIFVEQSFDYGQTWFVSASNAISACSTAACSTEIIGNAVRVRLLNGATAASIYRAYFYLRPI